MTSELHCIPNLIQLRLKYSYQKGQFFFFLMSSVFKRLTEDQQSKLKGREEEE